MQIGVGMSDLIDRQNAIDVLEILSDKMSEKGQTVMAQAVAVLKDLHSAEPENRVKVELNDGWFHCCECDYCTEHYSYNWNYCPSCGAKLWWNE